jgi:hypothetical protein
VLDEDLVKILRQKQAHLIKKSINIIKSWNFPVEVLGVWVNDQWKIEQVDE